MKYINKIIWAEFWYFEVNPKGKNKFKFKFLHFKIRFSHNFQKHTSIVLSVYPSVVIFEEKEVGYLRSNEKMKNTKMKNWEKNSILKGKIHYNVNDKIFPAMLVYSLFSIFILKEKPLFVELPWHNKLREHVA